MSTHPRRQIISGLGFAEAPRWHQGKLWLVDFMSGHVLRSDLDGNVDIVATVDGMPGGLGFLPDGTPLVVSQRNLGILRIRKDGQTDLYADLSEFARGAANELFVDRAGRAYVGHHGFDFFGGAPLEPSSLLLVRPNGKIETVAEELTFPNGTALLPDGKTLVVAESFANRLTAFDLSENGRLGNRRVWADLRDHTPDGICADVEGAIWAASPMTGAFVRVREGGQILDTIKTVDDRWATACAFVGDDLQSLCCLTADTTLEGMPRGESEAFVDIIDVDVPGVRTE